MTYRFNRVKSGKGGPVSARSGEAGFALLIAVIFMTVMLTFGLALGSLGYKQQTLASAAVQSHYAFYAADSALECVLHADQQQGAFDYESNCDGTPNISVSCAGQIATPTPEASCSGNPEDRLEATLRFELDSDTRCAEVTMYKPPPDSGDLTFIFSEGYNVACSKLDAIGLNTRFVSRGIYTHY